MTVLSTLPTLAPLLASDAPTQAPSGSGPFTAVMTAFVLLIVLFFVIVLPKRAQDKQARKLIDSLKINDKVMTTAGIIGTITSIDKEGGEVVLRVDDSTKIRFAVGAIYFVYNKDAAKDGQAKKK